MSWLQALLLGLVQGLTEFLPVSSSGHLMIVRELLGVDAEGFLDFTVLVHLATVLSTIAVFWKQICKILAGFFKFKMNDETDYVLKIIVSMVPVAIVGLFFKDQVELLFGESLTTVAVCLLVTAVLLFLSDKPWTWGKAAINAVRTGAYEAASFNGGGTGLQAVDAEGNPVVGAGSAGQGARSGISYWQAFVVGLGQAIAVAPGLSRSGTTIATGLLCGVKRDVMAQFSFLMVLVPIVGEQFLSLLEGFGESASASAGLGAGAMIAGFLGAFLSGLFACKAMVALVRKAKLSWFALYCAIVAVLIFVLQ